MTQSNWSIISMRMLLYEKLEVAEYSWQLTSLAIAVCHVAYDAY